MIVSVPYGEYMKVAMLNAFVSCWFTMLWFCFSSRASWKALSQFLTQQQNFKTKFLMFRVRHLFLLIRKNPMPHYFPKWSFVIVITSLKLRQSMILKGWKQIHIATPTTRTGCQSVGMSENNRSIWCFPWPKWYPVKRKVKLATVFFCPLSEFSWFFNFFLSSELQNSSFWGRPRLTVGFLGLMERMFAHLWRRGFIFTETLPEQQVSGWMLFTLLMGEFNLPMCVRP